MSGGLGYELKIKADLLAIFAELLPHGEQSSDLPRSSWRASKIERIKPVLHFMHEHYKERILIQELASLIPMSEGHFCRFLKRCVTKDPVRIPQLLSRRESDEVSGRSKNPHY